MLHPGVYGVRTVVLITTKACRANEDALVYEGFVCAVQQHGRLGFPRRSHHYVHVPGISSDRSLLPHHSAPGATCLGQQNNRAWVLHARCFHLEGGDAI